PQALSALLSRLSLPPTPTLHSALLSCLTHPSFLLPESEETVDSNSILDPLGNSLLGLFASEHLSTLFPNLPTEALKSAVTAYVGPSACTSVARELGVGAQGGGNSGVAGQGRGMASAGVAVRWTRALKEDKPETTPVAKGFRKHEEGHRRWEKKATFEDAVASTVRAFVGLIYQEQVSRRSPHPASDVKDAKGIHAAREFTHAHFLSRHLDLTSIFKFHNPKHLLSSVVTKYLSDAGVSPSEYAGRIESRVLASTGKSSLSPLFNIGLFLPSGLKLAEGHGSSLVMADHRAAVNALHSIFLVRGKDLSLGGLPSSIHGLKTLAEGKVGEGASEERYIPVGGNGEGEGVVGSSKKRQACADPRIEAVGCVRLGNLEIPKTLLISAGGILWKKLSWTLGSTKTISTPMSTPTGYVPARPRPASSGFASVHKVSSADSGTEIDSTETTNTRAFVGATKRLILETGNITAAEFAELDAEIQQELAGNSRGQAGPLGGRGIASVWRYWWAFKS
ncbi:large subunit ribosomal protein L44, partial [Tremellales sp. Uapishka_1]